ncbi:MAG: SURF1 family protein [Abyssibacter sp.]|uniref:SURF1 family protein n=1 Tax=Abyssibacter sp. TaxID=2320200 RepID=UPI00321B6BA9
MKLRHGLIAVLVLSLSALMMSACIWQLRRGLERSAQLEAEKAMAAVAPAPVELADVPATGGTRRVQVQGEFEPTRQVLLDNQTRDGQFGYRVWTVLQSGGQSLLVDRGWVAGKADRLSRPEWLTPSGSVTLVGRWSALPRAGWATTGNPCPVTDWPVRMTYPDAADLRCALGMQLLPGLLRLDPTSDHGFARSTVSYGLPPERHFGYAGQWAGLTLALWILTWIVWSRRER